MSPLSTAIEMVMDPYVIFLIFVGVGMGIIVGAIPGLTPSMALAVLIPFTFGLPPIHALSMLCGITIGGTYGGSIAAILLRVPGAPAALMTSLDGYPLAQKGEAGRAIGISTTSSFLGGLFGAIVLVMVAPYLAKLALKFGAPEYFALCCFGLSIVASLSRGSLLKGLISAALGVLITTVGMDQVTGVPRFTYGIMELRSGFSFVPVMIGLFGVSEVFKQLSVSEFRPRVEQNITRVLPRLEDLKRIWKVILRCSCIGTFIGALPGAGGTIAAIVGYNDAKQSSKYPEKFGTGMIEGIAASESANNSATCAAYIPMLTLGVPGDAMTAILIGAFMIHGLVPGPVLYRDEPELILALYVALFFAHIFLILFGFAGIRFFARVITIRSSILLPAILLFCIVGAYAYENKLMEILVILVFGIIGYFMEKNDFPIPPMVLGVVLGPIAEFNLRQAVMLGEGNLAYLFLRPIALVFWLLIIVSLVGSRIWKKKGRSETVEAV